VRAVLLCLVVGCYTPTPPQGLPCGDGDSCPTGQRCFDGVCRVSAPPGGEVDSMPADDTAPPTDGPLPNPMSLRFGERSDAIADTMVDTFLVSDPGEVANNFGAHTDLHLTSGLLDPVLLRVDVSSIPQGATVTSATLIVEVTFNTVDAGTKIRVFAVNESWTEGSGDHSAGIANQTQRHQNVAWSSAGAAPPSRDSTPAGSTTINALVDVGGDLAIEVPAELVQAWVDDPTSNNGIALIALGTDFYAELGSSEAANEFNRPVLEVEIK
jgi:hypothetical protein